MLYAVLMLFVSLLVWRYRRLAFKTKRAIRGDYRDEGIISFEYLSEDFMLLPNCWLKHILKRMVHEKKVLIFATKEGTGSLDPEEAVKQIRSGTFWVKTQ
jgi:hypothetical protein